MACESENDWLDARIVRTRTLIAAYEDAIETLAAGAFSYTLDTGQTRQSVTRSNVSSLRLILDQLENRLATLQARRCGGSVRMVPGW